MHDKSINKELHQQADALLDKGRSGDARKIYEKLCLHDDGDADAWLMIGSIDGEAGKLNSAISSVRKSIEIDPDYPDAYYILARLLVADNKIDGACENLIKAVQLDSTYTEALVMLAKIEGNRKKYVDAEKYSRQALLQDQTNIDAQLCLANSLYSQGKHEPSIVPYRIVVENDPQLSHAWTRLGAALLQIDAFSESEEALHKALSIKPGDKEALISISQVHIANKKYVDAIDHIQTVLKNDPDDDIAWHLLAIAGTGSDDSLSWIQCCQQLVDLFPFNQKTYLGLGYALEYSNQNDRALDVYQGAIELDSRKHEAWSRKGIVFAKIEHYDEAISSLHQALKLGSNSPQVHCGYGSMLRRKGQFEESEKHCRISTELLPDWAPGFIEHGRVLTDMGLFDEAKRTYYKAIDLNPGDKNGIAGLAEVYERMAMPDKAYEIIKQNIDNIDINSQIACVYAKISLTIGQQDNALRQIENTLENNELTIQQKIDLNFRAADIYKSQKMYDEAMKYYAQANKMKPVVYDKRIHSNFINDIKTIFNRDLIEKLQQSSISTERPVFIVGMPRSGTSLIEQILSSHDRVFGAGELMELSNLATRLGLIHDSPVPDENQIKLWSDETLQTLSMEYITAIEKLDTNTDRVTDKMPGNFIWLGLIQILLPNARVIHVMRNPLDTCLSCYFTDFNGVHEYAYNLENLGHYYCEYMGIMNHWKSVFPLKILDVEYERLVTQPEAVSRQMLEFCGLEWDPKVLEFHASNRMTKTASYLQVRKPIYTSSINMSNNYKKHIEPLVNILNSCSQ